MADSSIIVYLIVMTFVAVIVYAAVQLIKTRKAKQNHTHSAMGDGPRQPVSSTGGPGSPPQL